jgi:hypothetical protein
MSIDNKAPRSAQISGLVLVDGIYYPEGYDVSAFRNEPANGEFYLAVFGPRDRLETLCEYVAQMITPSGDLCPQLLWPEFGGGDEAFLVIQENPKPWQIAEAVPDTQWLGAFARLGLTVLLAGHNGPVMYCEGWNCSDAVPDRFIKALSAHFPDLTFVTGGVHTVFRDQAIENWAYGANFEIRNKKLLRSRSHDLEEFSYRGEESSPVEVHSEQCDCRLCRPATEEEEAYSGAKPDDGPNGVGM